MPGDRRRQPKPDKLRKLGVGGEGVVGGKRCREIPGGAVGEPTDSRGEMELNRPGQIGAGQGDKPLDCRRRGLPAPRRRLVDQEPYPPAAHERIGVVEASQEEGLIEGHRRLVDRGQGPQGAEAMSGIGSLGGMPAEPGEVGGEVVAPQRPLLPLAHRRAAPPLISDEEIAAQRRPFEPGDVDAGRGPWGTVDKLVDPAAGAMNAVMVVALAGIGPIGDVDPAVGAADEIHAAIEGIGDEAEIFAVRRGVAGPERRETVVVDPSAVEVEGEHPAPVLLRPVGAAVNHQADVGVAPAGGAGLVGDAKADVAPLLAGIPMDVVSHLRNEVVNMRLQIRAIHPLGVCPVDGMPQMADDGVDDERLAMLVEVGAPGVRHPGDHPLNDLAAGMVAPHAGVDLHPLRIPRPRDADPRRCLDPVPSPQPAIRAPLQAVAGGMADALFVDPVEDDLGGAVGDEIVVAIGDEEKMGEVDQPHPSEPHRHARQPRAAIPKHRPLVVRPVAIGIGEHRDPVAERVIPSAEVAPRPGEVLRHPHPASCIGTQADRVLNIGLGGEHLERKAGGELRSPADLGRIDRCLGRLLGVWRHGEIVRRRAVAEQHRADQQAKHRDRSEPSLESHAVPCRKLKMLGR